MGIADRIMNGKGGEAVEIQRLRLELEAERKAHAKAVERLQALCDAEPIVRRGHMVLCFVDDVVNPFLKNLEARLRNAGNWDDVLTRSFRDMWYGQLEELRMIMNGDALWYWDKPFDIGGLKAYCKNQKVYTNEQTAVAMGEAMAKNFRLYGSWGRPAGAEERNGGHCARKRRRRRSRQRTFGEELVNGDVQKSVDDPRGDA